MQACAEAHPGGMAAVLGKNEEQILELIAATEEKDVLLPVNFNCPGQIVVAGDEKSLAAFWPSARSGAPGLCGWQ